MAKPDERWWLADTPEEMARQAWAIASELYGRDGIERRRNAKDGEELYEGLSTEATEAPSYNVVQASVDTMVAHTIRTKVRPFFLTEKGDYDDRERAEGMQRAVEGDFTRAGIWGQLGTDFCYDGNLYEAGGLKLQPDYANKQVLIERVFSWEFFVPPREARRGKPEQGFHILDIDRAVLRGRIPEDAKDRAKIIEAIDNAPNAPMDWFDLDEVGEDEVSDRILVADCFHLPSTVVDRDDDDQWDIKKATHDGVHGIVIGGDFGDTSKECRFIALEAWPFPHFGIAWYKPRKKRRSYWSRSVPETVVSGQIAINRMNKRVDSVMHLHAVPRVYVWNKARINTDKITNAHDGIIEGDQPAGQALQWMTPTSVPAEYLMRVDKIIGWCEKVLGLPEFSIVADKPKGIEHAPALQFLEEEHSIRHTQHFRSWEDAIVDAAKIWVDMARLLAKKVPDFEVMWGDAKDLKRIKWKDVDLDDERFHLRVWPTNLLPQTPGAKLDRIVTMKREGLITPMQGLLFLGLEFPDIEMMLGDGVATEENIRQRIQSVVKKGYSEDNAPDAYINLEMAKAIGIDRINFYEANGLPEEKLDELRLWVEDVKDKIAEMAAEEAAKAAMGAPPPPGSAPTGPEGTGPAPGPQLPLGAPAGPGPTLQ